MAASSMATRDRPLFSQPPQPVSSQALSVAHSSPPSTFNGSLGSYPITATSFSSSPPLSPTQTRSSASPDLFEDLTYTEAMEDDLRRIDSETASILEAESPSYHVIPIQDNGGRLSVVHRDQKTWVVFNGKVPGIYDCW